MRAVNALRFEEFYRALHQQEPFPWQRMLAAQAAAADGSWPDVLDLPTASGKTACIDVAVFALACQAGQPTWQRTAPRRIWFVVDRRIIVDEAFARASRIAEKLRGAPRGILREVAEALRQVNGETGIPLAVARLRGGVQRDLAWLHNPVQAAVITSTVDQVGSRLLFRAYGAGERAAPVHAGLAGQDSLVILDEAHCARPFLETAQAIARYRQNPWCRTPVQTPFQVVVMSATPPQSHAGSTWKQWPAGKERTVALKHPVLQERMQACKPAELAVAQKPRGLPAPLAGGDDPLVVDAAQRAAAFVRQGHKTRVAVMVNRVATAQAVAAALVALRAAEHEYDVAVLVGRMRPLDRDAVVRSLEGDLKAGNRNSRAKPVIVVTTQCLEVGADFSFEALVTECASLDALRQRFGRLNRMGLKAWSPAPAAILIRARDAAAKEPDRIYGSALAATWNWLSSKAKGGTIDMGIAALEENVPTGEELQKLLAPALSAPLLLPAYLDLLAQSSPRPEPEPEAALFLHGAAGDPEVRLVWRSDLAAGREGLWPAVALACPPSSLEALPVPLWKARAWLSGEASEEDTGDVETAAAAEPGRQRGKDNSPARCFLIYRGRAEALEPTTRTDDLRPGDTVLVPASYGWKPELGYKPDIRPLDLYDEVVQKQQGRRGLRVCWEPPPDLETTDTSLRRLDAAQAYRRGEQTRRAFHRELNEVLRTDETLRARLGDRIDVADGYPPEVGFMLLGPPDRAPELQREVPSEAWLDEPPAVPGEQATLPMHLRRVEEATRRWARLCLPPDLARAVAQAAAWHDLGKADPRMQLCLANGRQLRPELLAKSQETIAPARWRRLQTQAGLPVGFRHEMLSMQMALGTLTDQPARDLITHLIAAHHGYARPFAPVVEDPPPVSPGTSGGPRQLPDVVVRIGKGDIRISGAQRMTTLPHRLDSGVAERFWRLTREYGWWGLAYLETLVRLADQAVSRADAQEDNDA